MAPCDATEIRPATQDDMAAIDTVIAQAYARYVPDMDKPPAPMLDDYGARIAAGEAYVFTRNGEISGVLILVDSPDHLMLDNIAVSPAAQGKGVGRALMSFADDEAGRRRYRELRLYTHVVMSANVAYYETLGWEETHRGEENGYARIYMRKRLEPANQ